MSIRRIATQRLYLTADKQTVVGHDDLAAAFLLCGVGQAVPADAPEIPEHLIDAPEGEQADTEEGDSLEKVEKTIVFGDPEKVEKRPAAKAKK